MTESPLFTAMADFDTGAPSSSLHTRKASRISRRKRDYLRKHEPGLPEQLAELVLGAFAP